MTLKQQLKGEQWDVELGHLPAFGWSVLFFAFFVSIMRKVEGGSFKSICHKQCVARIKKGGVFL